MADNTIAELRKFFHHELGDKMDAGETEAVFLAAAESILGWPRTKTITARDERLNQSDLLRMYDCAKAVSAGEPLQYVLGEVWFCDIRLRVDRNVLIPRPETEELVHLISADCGSRKQHVLDIGTGSGCIAIALSKMCPALEVSACDISRNALDVARQNAQNNNAPVKFLLLDILLGEPTGTYDVIVSNPPYVMPSEAAHLEARVLNHEPALALFSLENDPVNFYRRIIALCREHLSPQGMLWFELNPLTCELVRTLATESRLFSEIALLHDLSGKIRFLKAKKLSV